MTTKTTKAAPKAVSLIVGTAALKKEGQAVLSAAGRLTDRIQTFLVSAAVHAHQHSDAEALLDVLNATGRGLRMNAMREWAMQYAPVDVSTTGKLCFSRPYENADEESRTAAIEAAKNSPVWDSLKPEAPFVPFDLDKAIQKLLERAEAAAADTEHKDAHKVSPEKLAALKVLQQS